MKALAGQLRKLRKLLCAATLRLDPTNLPSAVPLAIDTPLSFAVTVTPSYEFDYDSASGLNKLLLKAEPKFEMKFGLAMAVATSASYGCKKKLFQFVIPFSGPLAWLAAGRLAQGQRRRGRGAVRRRADGERRRHDRRRLGGVLPRGPTRTTSSAWCWCARRWRHRRWRWRASLRPMGRSAFRSPGSRPRRARPRSCTPSSSRGCCLLICRRSSDPGDYLFDDDRELASAGNPSNSCSAAVRGAAATASGGGSFTATEHNPVDSEDPGLAVTEVTFSGSVDNAVSLAVSPVSGRSRSASTDGRTVANGSWTLIAGAQPVAWTLSATMVAGPGGAAGAAG
jgi:hypothetical protein